MVSDPRAFLKEDIPPSNLREVVHRSEKPLHLKIFSGIDRLFVFVIVKIFSGLAYDRCYLKGRHFEHFWCAGWRWTYNGMFAKLFKGAGRGIPWPVSSQGTFSRNIDFHIDDLNNFQGPTYFQTFGDTRIKLGRGIWIARGTSLITTNHDLANPDIHTKPKSIELGDHCWLGVNVAVMPGVILGPHTVVGANAVVTKSFPEGWCVLGGIPARRIKGIERPTDSEHGNDDN